jgi:hypothetical protein
MKRHAWTIRDPAEAWLIPLTGVVMLSSGVLHLDIEARRSRDDQAAIGNMIAGALTE